MPTGNYGPGYPAILAPTVAPLSSVGSGGVTETPIGQVEGYAFGTVTLTGSPEADDTVTVSILGNPVTYTLDESDTTLALAATHLASAINDNDADSAIVNAAASGAVVTITAKAQGAAGLYSLSASATGITATASGSEFTLPNNVVVPLQTVSVAMPGGSTQTLYAGIPISVDPGTRAFLRNQGYIA